MTVEDQLAQWAKAPGPSERQRCDNAVSVVKTAINNSDVLGDKTIRIFAQGSYRNRTNVRQDSDVDICVLCTNTFYYELPDGKNRDDFRISPATYNDNEFRKDVQESLVNQFGSSNISVGNKAWNISENTYRVTADVVSCFEYRYYFENGQYLEGTAVLLKSGTYICNFPEQNYQNGKIKKDNTSNRFRSAVRILKNLNNQIVEQSADFAGLPSFLIESLVWNVPNEGFGHDAYLADIQWILAYLCNETRSDDTCIKWCEINGIKYLFYKSQKWNRAEANSALNTYWRYFNF